jgi:protein gp37
MPGYTFNGWWGCTEAGPECDNCYARTFSHRLGFELWGADAPRRFFGDKHWGEPFKWDRKARELGEQHLVFCQSMSDVLEDRRDLDSARGDLWCLIESTPNLIWLLLTKRPGKFATLTPERWRRNGWPPNVWAGATSGTQRTADVMIPQLQRAAEAAAVLWLSVEPLLERVRLAGAIQIGRPRISWVIVGAESGGRARPMQTSWVQSLRDECINAGAAFFFKQDAVGGRKISMPLLDGRVWREFPRTAA